MKNKLLIIGASGHGKVVADIALKMEKWDCIAFLDDDESKNSSAGLEIIGNLNDIYNYIHDCDIFVGIGDNVTRQRIHELLAKLGAHIPILIHPNAVIGREVEMGAGTVVMAGAIVNCCTTIGRGCIINTGSTLDHDNYIENFVHISPGVHLAGSVRIGERTWLGIGSVVSNNINITNDCRIGAGTVVVKDINIFGTYLGVPARRV